MIKKLSLIITLLFIFVAVNAYALDTSTDTSQQKKHDTEEAQTQKKHHEQKESEGKKKSKSESEGRDKQTQQAVKSIGQSMRQGGADISLSLKAIYMPALIELERTTEPFISCRVLSQPKLARDFGLTAQIDDYTIDTIKAEYLNKAAGSNAPVRTITNEKTIKEYIQCLNYYGSVIAQSYLYLTNDLTDLQTSLKFNDDKITVEGLGYDDFIALAESSLQKTLQTGITNKNISKYFKMALSDTECRFDKSIENILCPPSLVTLQSSPILIIAGVQAYGNDSFMGFQGSYKLSRNWSYNDSIEKLKSVSKYEKWAKEVSEYAEELESQGRSKDATMVRKKAWEIAESGKQTVSVGKLLPNIN